MPNALELEIPQFIIKRPRLRFVNPKCRELCHSRYSYGNFRQTDRSRGKSFSMKRAEDREERRSFSLGETSRGIFSFQWIVSVPDKDIWMIKTWVYRVKEGISSIYSFFVLLISNTTVFQNFKLTRIRCVYLFFYFFFPPNNFDRMQEILEGNEGIP